MARKIEEYDERFEFLRYEDGYRSLLPNEWDVAASAARVATAEQKLKELDEEEVPPEIAAFERVMELFEGQQEPRDGERMPSAAQYARADRRYTEWENSRIGQRLDRAAALRAAKHALAELEQYPDDPAKRQAFAAEVGARLEVETYQMRLLKHRERLHADDNHLAVEQESHRIAVQVNARNVELLGYALLGQRVDGSRVEIGEPDEELEDTLCMAMIGRMWSRNSMSDGLRSYFRSRRAAAGLEPAPGRDAAPE